MAHDHDHDHGGGLLGKVKHFAAGHSHDPAQRSDAALAASRQGMRALSLSLAGLGLTALAELVVVIISKFTYGAWIVVVILPILVFVLHTLGTHHQRLVRHLRVSSAEAAARVLGRTMRHHVVITVGRIDRAVLQAVAYAKAMDAEIEAVYITDDLARGEELRRHWEAMHISTPLVVLDSPIRHHTTALLRYLDFIQRRTDEHEVFVTVVLPEVLPTRWIE